MALHVLDEANRCLGCKKPMCQQGCPIHTNIPEVIRLLKDNHLDDAGRMLFENNPLTTVCSLVCNHENQCEGHCIRNRMPRDRKSTRLNSSHNVASRMPSSA